MLDASVSNISKYLVNKGLFCYPGRQLDDMQQPFLWKVPLVGERELKDPELTNGPSHGTSELPFEMRVRSVWRGLMRAGVAGNGLEL